MPKRNLAWILVITMITLLMWQLPQIIVGRDAVYRAFGPLVDARAQIHRRFVDEVDDSRLTYRATESGIRAMIGELGDPHAAYFSEKEYAGFKNRTDGVFGGIGVDVWPSDAGLEVLSRAPNSPAAIADILPGDVITHIDGRPTVNVPLVDAVNGMLNGAPETRVSLTVHRPSDGSQSPPRQVIVERAVIHVEPILGWSRAPAGGWRFMLEADAGIAYIRLTKFTPDADEKLDSYVDRLLRTGMKGLVLDLRDNTGGLLDSAREVADRFLESGLIVRTAGRKSDEQAWYAMRDGTYPNFPLVVLVNASTASAAEIVAGALRDHERAAVVGERTFGKGSVQEVVELDRGAGAVKLTTAYYYLPSGQCIHRTARSIEENSWGVAPTLPVTLTEKQRAKWLVAWREQSREILTPTSLPANTASQPSEEEASRKAAAVLLDADLQLAKAVEYLHAKLQSPTTTQADSN